MPQKPLDVSWGVLGYFKPTANKKPLWGWWLGSLPYQHAPKRLTSSGLWYK